MPRRSVLTILADGARADLFERLLARGRASQHPEARHRPRRLPQGRLDLHQHHRPGPPAVPDRLLPGHRERAGLPLVRPRRLPPRAARRPLVPALLQRPGGVPLPARPGPRDQDDVRAHRRLGQRLRRRHQGREEGQQPVRAREEPRLAVGALRPRLRERRQARRARDARGRRAPPRVRVHRLPGHRLAEPLRRRRGRRRAEQLPPGRQDRRPGRRAAAQAGHLRRHADRHLLRPRPLAGAPSTTTCPSASSATPACAPPTTRGPCCGATRRPSPACPATGCARST